MNWTRRPGQVNFGTLPLNVRLAFLLLVLGFGFSLLNFVVGTMIISTGLPPHPVLEQRYLLYLFPLVRLKFPRRQSLVWSIAILGGATVANTWTVVRGLDGSLTAGEIWWASIHHGVVALSLSLLLLRPSWAFYAVKSVETNDR